MLRFLFLLALALVLFVLLVGYLVPELLFWGNSIVVLFICLQLLEEFAVDKKLELERFSHTLVLPFFILLFCSGNSLTLKRAQEMETGSDILKTYSVMVGINGYEERIKAKETLSQEDLTDYWTLRGADRLGAKLIVEKGLDNESLTMLKFAPFLKNNPDFCLGNFNGGLSFLDLALTELEQLWIHFPEFHSRFRPSCKYVFYAGHGNTDIHDEHQISLWDLRKAEKKRVSGDYLTSINPGKKVILISCRGNEITDSHRSLVHKNKKNNSLYHLTSEGSALVWRTWLLNNSDKLKDLSKELEKE
jgi:hypothetical protein